VLLNLSATLDLVGVFIQADALHTQKPFRQLQELGSDFLLSVRKNQRRLHNQFSDQFLYSRQIPFAASDS
jgi:predicted transposase YbfD/YdcC